MAVVLLLVVVLPLLPLLAAKAVAVLAALVVVAGLYYMMVVPGGQPAEIAERRPRWPWNLVRFALVALAIVAATTAFVVLTEEKDWPPGRPRDAPAARP
jgi:hypothetical protein